MANDIANELTVESLALIINAAFDGNKETGDKEQTEDNAVDDFVDMYF